MISIKCLSQVVAVQKTRTFLATSCWAQNGVTFVKSSESFKTEYFPGGSDHCYINILLSMMLESLNIFDHRTFPNYMNGSVSTSCASLITNMKLYSVCYMLHGRW